MIIQTKFNPLEYVWILVNNKAKEVQIEHVVTFSADGISSIIEYKIGTNVLLREEQIFKDQQQLIASIIT